MFNNFRNLLESFLIFFGTDARSSRLIDEVQRAAFYVQWNRSRREILRLIKTRNLSFWPIGSPITVISPWRFETIALNNCERPKKDYFANWITQG